MCGPKSRPMACDDMKRLDSIRGFTLVELLVTMGLMALLATVSIGGYYGAVRGMTERGAKQDVVSFLRLARQRALVDQVPTAVIFMNKKLANENLDLGESDIVVGEAIAVRRVGRISYIDSRYLADEFGDLDKTYPTEESETSSSGNKAGMRIYRLQDQNVKYSVVRDHVVQIKLSGEELFGLGAVGGTVDLPDNTTFDPNAIKIWAFEVISGGNASWKVGDAYGTEIASLQLPHGYVFGSSVPSQVGAVSDVGNPCFFNPDDASTLDVNMSFNGIDVRAYVPTKGGQQLKRVFSVSSSDLNDNQ